MGSNQAGLPGPSSVEDQDARHVLVPWKKQSANRGMEITKADGVYLWDRDDRQYLDFTSQFVFANFGHNEARVVDAIVDQAHKLMEVASPFVTGPKAEAASLLSRVTPGDLNRVFFSTGGAEANEAAIKMARDATGRPLICSRSPSYHGSTYGAMSVSENVASRAFEPGVPGVLTAPVCNPYRCRHAQPGERCQDCGGHCAQELEEVLLQHGPERVAAVMLEPIVGSSGGAIVPGDGYLEAVREICNKYGILLIADEVMTGFGRTGRWFACDHWGVVPDLMTLAKGLTGGYIPMGATVVREAVAAHWNDRPLRHGHTYSGHTLGAAAVVASVKVYQEDNLVARSADLGEYLLERASELQARHPSIGDVRGKGLFVAAELVQDRRTKEPIGGVGNASAKEQILADAWQAGLYLFSPVASNVIMLSPPLTISKDQIDEAMTIVDSVLKSADARVNTSTR
ncbi:MAG TPA: aspartate aminotransferase family protein [Candidatus Acidoferrales bacterium]|nr:aspartate aminotransferase family protein [Candidatus Acidoferrales bacterium]